MPHLREIDFLLLKAIPADTMNLMINRAKASLKVLKMNYASPAVSTKGIMLLRECPNLTHLTFASPEDYIKKIPDEKL